MKPDAVPMFDSHCHLQMPVFAGDLPAVLERARQEGLEGAVIIGMDAPSSQTGDRPGESTRGRLRDRRRASARRKLPRRRRPPGAARDGTRAPRRRDRRDGPRLLPQPLAAGRAAEGISGAAGPGRRGWPAGRHPFATGERGDVRHPARVGDGEAPRDGAARRAALLRRRRETGANSTRIWASCYHSPET